MLSDLVKQPLSNDWLHLRSLDHPEIGVHIVPDRDLREHDLTDEGGCWCSPTTDWGDSVPVTVHNSLDQRERFDWGWRKPS